jgi:hypothetical protein
MFPVEEIRWKQPIEKFNNPLERLEEALAAIAMVVSGIISLV